MLTVRSVNLNVVHILVGYIMNHCIVRQYSQPWKMTGDMAWLDLGQQAGM